MAKGKKTGGRVAGVPNKLTKDVKTAILNAFNKVGGESYLVMVAKKDHKTFCALLGRVLPLQLAGDPDAPIHHVVAWLKNDE